jgi:acetylornithine/succinyldiaminopimelate/putrescine aminotransferase
VVLAKALGGGLPLGAFCGSDRIIGVLADNPPLGHITTFGGHPLSCAAGLAALELIVEERLWEQASAIGDRLRRGLLHLVSSKLAEVRTIGALLGIEFATAAAAQSFVRETLARGVVVNWTLNAERVVRLAPPLTMSAQEADFAIEMMSAALEASRAIGKASE